MVKIDFNMPDLGERFRAHHSRLAIAIASDIQTNRGLLFDAEGNYNGHTKWKDLASGLNKKTAANGLQVRQILRRKGTLKNSIAPSSHSGTAGPQGYVRTEGDYSNPVVTVGTNVKYARIHNEGGIINHPGSNNGFGRGIKIPAHKIPMPKRNFTDWTEEDMKSLEAVVANTIVEILNGR